MAIAVTGASGFLGRALTARLIARGDKVLRLVRGHARGADELAWDPAGGSIDRAGLEGTEAVVHLAGESIGQRWTDARKRQIRESRVAGTRLLAEALAGLKQPPAVFISASALGYYGPTAPGVVADETHGPGQDFLAEVAAAWENAAAPARARGIRVVHPRFSSILHPSGGALAKMLPVFRAGLGGRLGSGAQPMSWIALDDAVAALVHILATPALQGPVNVSAPAPSTNALFTAALARALGRPALMPVPSFALRLAFGEMAEALLLSGTAVKPSRLLATGFVFTQPDLPQALAAMLATRPGG